MLNRCNNCGGELIYDITSASLKCIYCDSVFEPEDYKEETDANQQNDFFNFDVTLYTCPNCGAQISSTDNASVDYCLYCGSFVSLEQELSKVRRPDYIVPFSKTPDDCKASYKRMIRKKLYAPKEFRDATFLDGFKGIYIPYWSYEYTYGPKIRLHGSQSTRHGDYLHEQKFNIDCQVSGDPKEVVYDASSNFDDQLSKRILPYDKKKRKPFSPAYMFGFYGDTANVPDVTYQDEAKDIAKTELIDELIKSKQVASGHPDSSAKYTDEDLNLKEQHKLTLLPVWFLTWKNKDRIAYSIINGDDGNIYSEIPVSIWRYIIISLITAVPIFLVLNSLFTFSASNMLLVSTILSGIMILLYALELELIIRRNLHADDKGYLALYQNGENPEINENLFLDLLKVLFESPKEIISSIGALIFIIVAIGVGMSIIVFFALLIIVPVYTFFCIKKQSKIIGDKHAITDVAGAYIAYIVSGIIIFLDPAANIFYYIAAIICLIMIGHTAIKTMDRYNDMITRPLPHFFDRRAGGTK